MEVYCLVSFVENSLDMVDFKRLFQAFVVLLILLWISLFRISYYNGYVLFNFIYFLEFLLITYNFSHFNTFRYINCRFFQSHALMTEYIFLLYSLFFYSRTFSIIPYIICVRWCEIKYHVAVCVLIVCFMCIKQCKRVLGIILYLL